MQAPPIQPRPRSTPAGPRRAYATPVDDEDYGDEFEGSQAVAHSKGNQLKRLALALLRRWPWIALGLLLGLLAGFYVLSKSPKIYSATATLVVKHRAASVMTTADPLTEIDMGTVEAMNTVAERLKRVELLEKVAARLDIRQMAGLVPPPVKWLPGPAGEWFGGGDDDEQAGSGPPSAGTVGAMLAESMKISLRRGTRLLDVSVEHQTPEVAKALADAITREYITEMAANRYAGRSSAIELLTRESEKARGRLEEASTAQVSYGRALNIHNLLESTEVQIDALARRYRDKHPRMIAARDQLDVLRERFLSEFESARLSGTDKTYWDTVADEWNATEGDQEKRLATARRLLLSRTSILESVIKSQTQVFNMILTRIHEDNIEQEKPEAEIEISNLARTPGMPVRPGPAAVLAKAGAGGLAVGLAIAFLLVKFDTKFRTVGQLEQVTGLPVLGVIGDLQPKRLAAAIDRQAQRLEQRGGQIPPVPSGQQHWDPRIVFRHGLTSGRFAEMFRALRASVCLLGDERERKVTLFTSATPGEGKTLIVANFALAAARQRRRTLAIDLDLRQPALHKCFGVTADHGEFGIADVLAGSATLEQAIVSLDSTPGLDLVLRGRQSQPPGELLDALHLDEIFAEARSRYDVVVIDSAPLLAVPDTRLLTRLVDNLCLVVRAEQVPIGAVRNALEILGEVGTTPDGVVFNDLLEKRQLAGAKYSYAFNNYHQYNEPDSP